MAKKDTILGHCIARAVIADAGGEEAAAALHATKWQAFKLAAKVTPRASRVASFVAMWGLAMYDLGRDELTVDEYAEWANEPRATAFRRAAEYRELWGGVDVNELAGHVRDHLREDRSARNKPNALMSVAVSI